MDTFENQLNSLQSKEDNFFKTTRPISMGEIGIESSGYLDPTKLFIAYFNKFPNYIHEIKIDCKKANDWFLANFKSEVKDCFYDKLYTHNKNKLDFDDIFYLLYEDLLINFDKGRSVVRFLFRKTDLQLVEAIIKGVHGFKKKKDRSKPYISLVIKSMNGLDTKELEITKPKLSVADNYNDDFNEIHQTITKRLSKKGDKGLVLLHGKPGTGKTSYIRYLISSIKKEVIFLPPNMAEAITNPDLMGLLIDNPNSIFVIEDAENIVVDREREKHSPVSALLNLSDGLLSDCLNIQIVCSFNTDISKVDSALLRKGRLIAQYEFKELELKKAQALSDKLGFTNTLTRPMTLSEIYNQDDKDFNQQKQRPTIGFNAYKTA